MSGILKCLSAKHYKKTEQRTIKNTKVIGGEVRLGRQWQHHSGDKPLFSSTETVQHSIWWVVWLVWHMWAASTTWVVKKYEWLQHAGYIWSNSTLLHVVFLSYLFTRSVPFLHKVSDSRSHRFSTESVKSWCLPRSPVTFVSFDFRTWKFVITPKNVICSRKTYVNIRGSKFV